MIVYRWQYSEQKREYKFNDNDKNASWQPYVWQCRKFDQFRRNKKRLVFFETVVSVLE